MRGRTHEWPIPRSCASLSAWGCVEPEGHAPAHRFHVERVLYTAGMIIEWPDFVTKHLEYAGHLQSGDRKG